MDPLLKQRLVGAAVLFGLAVIFVPMILDGPVDRTPAHEPDGIPLAVPQPGAAYAAARPADAQPEPRAVQVAAAQERTDAGGAYAVQLGSFSASANAEALAERVRTHGFDAFVQQVEVAGGTMYRVRVGPSGSRGGAEALAARVQRATGERAVVVPHP